MAPGTVFKLKTHEDRDDIEIFMCEDLDEKGKEFWLRAEVLDRRFISYRLTELACSSSKLL